MDNRQEAAVARTNKQILLKSRPQGWVTPDNFELAATPAPAPGDGDVLVRNLYMSVDPYMRGRMMDRKSYVPPFQIGEPLKAGVVGQVAESNNPNLKPGQIVTGMLDWAQYTLVKGGTGLMPIPPTNVPLSYYLGVLGMPGMTAYVGLLDIGKPKQGETVYVSAAAGAVGQIVGQLAKMQGCRVVGSAGDDAKVAWLTEEAGYDAAFNYKTVSSLNDALAEHCPKGIDVYFENVGGAMLDAVLTRMNMRGRIVACGMISQYNLEKPEGVRNLMMVVGNRLLIQGFIVSDHFDRLPQFIQQMSGWLAEGKVTYREDVAEGIENAPAAFIGMLKGENFGKQVVKIADPEG
jgi:NADPH-dependent curcumin reductase CurA